MLLWLRRLAVGLCAVLVLAVALFGGGYAYLQTEAGRQRVTDEVFRALTTVDDVSVRIEGLAGSIPFGPKAARLVIEDATGPWLEIVDTEIQVAAWPLFFGRIDIDLVTARQLHWLRVPEFPSDDEPLPRYPFVVDVEVLRVEQVLLEPDVMDEIGVGWSTASVEGRGRVDMLVHRLSTEWSVSGREIVAGGLDLSVGSADAKLDVGGSFERPSLTSTAVLEDVVFDEYASGRLEIQADVTPERVRAEQVFSVAAHARAAGLRTPEAVAGLLGDRLDARLDGRFRERDGALDFESVALESSAARISAEVSRSGEGEVAVRGLSGRVADVGRAIPGAQSLSGVGSTVSGNLLFTADGLLKADAVIQTTGTPEADPWLAALLGAESKAGLRITGRPSQALHFELESLQTALVHGSGECDLGISDAGIEGAFDLRIDGIENLPIEGLEAAGGVLARVAVKGRIDGFSVDATVHPNELRIGEYPVTTGTVRAFVDELPGAASGSVEFDVASGELTLDGRLSGRVDFDGPWRIDDFDVRGLTTRATGRASGRSFEPPYAGRIEARIDDARRWAGLLGIHLIGQGVAEASFSANEGRQQISLEVSATEAEAFLPDLPDFEAVSLSVVAEVEDWSARRISKLDVEGNGLKLGLVRFDTLTLLGEVTGEDATVSVQAAGHYLNDFSVDAEAAVACVECAQRTFRVDSLEAAWEEVPIRLHAPVEVVTEGADFELRGLDASFGEGRLHGGWASAPWPGHGTITAEEIPVELATIVDPAFPFVGRFGGELRADTESKAAAMFDVSLRGLRLADTAGRDLAPVDLDLQGDVETGAIRFSSRMTASTDADVRVEATIPLIDGRFELDVSDPLRISAHGDVRSGFLGGLFLPPSERIRGALRVDLEAEGTVADPRLHGSVRSDDLGLVSGLTGLKLNGAAFEVLAHGASLELRRFEANDRRGGSVVAQGSASLADGNGVPEYSLRVNLDNLRMIDLDELTVVAGGRLDVSGRGTELRLGGRLTAASADMQLPERLPPDVVLVDVTHVNRREDSKEPGAPGDVPIPVELDLFLDFPGRVTIHAPGLISEWRGDVKVSGTSADPEVDGELRLIRGTIATAGLRFRMKEGRFVIDDDLPVPEIELLGESSRNNVTAIAKIHGPANDPTFELSSDPPLPQDEILSRLLFGTTPGRLTALQSVQLAQAVARFSGLSSGNDPLYQLQRATGIDRVEIKGGEGDEEAAISLGKYLTDRVFLSVDQGLTEQDSTARVEVDLTDNLSAQTEVGQDATTGVGVQWRITY